MFRLVLMTIFSNVHTLCAIYTGSSNYTAAPGMNIFCYMRYKYLANEDHKFWQGDEEKWREYFKLEFAELVKEAFQLQVLCCRFSILSFSFKVYCHCSIMSEEIQWRNAVMTLQFHAPNGKYNEDNQQCRKIIRKLLFFLLYLFVLSIVDTLDIFSRIFFCLL